MPLESPKHHKLFHWWAERCARVTSSGGYIAELDGVRFLALLMVFMLHLNHGLFSSFEAAGRTDSPTIQAFYHAAEFGALGVQLFFCISGFILGLPFAKSYLCEARTISLSKFYKRRLTRLEPPLVIHVFLMLLLYTFVEGKDAMEMVLRFLSTITYTHSTFFGEPSHLNPMTWSLEVEAQFYLLTPLLCLVFKIPGLRLRRAVILGVIVASAAFRIFVSKSYLPAQLPFFFAGFLLVDVYLLSWAKAQRKSGWAPWLFCGVLVAFPTLCYFHKSIPLSAGWMALIMFGFLVSVFRWAPLKRFFSLPFISITGGMCYTFYLYHLVVVVAFFRFFGEFLTGLNYFVAYAAAFLIVGGVNFLICSGLFILFERPFMKWRPVKGDWRNGLKIH